MSESKNIPYCTISRPIPHDARRRVWVHGQGHGYETHRLTLGSATTGIQVALDRGDTVIAAPAEVHPAGAVDFSNVVPLLRVVS